MYWAGRGAGCYRSGMATWNEFKATMSTQATLWSAAKDDDVPTLQRLLGEGAAIDAVDHRGFSPLMLAAYNGSEAAFEHLLASGANPNSADLAGNTVLMGAAFKGHLGMVKRLLAAGANPAATNQAGLDAKGFAAQFGRTEVVALLGS